MSMNRSVHLMMGTKMSMEETFGNLLWEDEYLEGMMDIVRDGISIVHGGEGDHDSLYIGRVLFSFNDHDYDEETTIFDLVNFDEFDIAREIREAFKDYTMPDVYYGDIKLISVVSWG